MSNDEKIDYEGARRGLIDSIILLNKKIVEKGEGCSSQDCQEIKTLSEAVKNLKESLM